MKLLLTLLVALSLTLAWQASVVAEEGKAAAAPTAQQEKDGKSADAKKAAKQTKSQDEPDCE